MNAIQVNATGDADEQPGWLEIVRRQAGPLRQGVAQIVASDPRVAQIEKTGRARLDKTAAQTKTIWPDRKAGA